MGGWNWFEASSATNPSRKAWMEDEAVSLFSITGHLRNNSLDAGAGLERFPLKSFKKSLVRG